MAKNQQSKDDAKAANLAFIQQLMGAGGKVEVISGEAPTPGDPQTSSSGEQDQPTQPEQAAEQAQPQPDAPAQDAAAEVDQDAIDAMMAARASKNAQPEPPAQEPAQEPAEQAQPQPDAPAQGSADDMDQNAIDALMAARKAKKQAASAPPSAEADQAAIDQMVEARQQGQADANAPSPQEKKAQKAINEMLGVKAETTGEGAGGGSAKAASPAASGGSASGAAPTAITPAGEGTKRRASVLHWLLLSNGVLIVMVLVGVLFMLHRRSGGPAPGQAAPATIGDVETPGDVGLPHPSSPSGAGADEQAEPALRLPDVGATTWAEAEAALLARKWHLALARYRKLFAMAQTRHESDVVLDLIRLRCGQCLQQLGRIDRAARDLTESSQSRSPIVSAYANYRLGRLRGKQGAFMRARTRAYMALASLGSVETPQHLEADCDFLIASTMTRKVLSFYNPDRPVFWREPEGTDPFMGMGETDLGRFLAEGIRAADKAMLGPVVKPGEHGGLDVSSWRAPIQEVLHRFEAETGIGVEWVSVSPASQRRPVTMFLKNASAQRVAEVACGVVGLVSRFDGDTVQVHDLRAESNLSDIRELAVEDARGAWRQYFLRRPDDPRVPEGHLALARLAEANNDFPAAIREFQLIAARHPRSDAAPEAMMRCANLKIRLLDYSGARKDLLTLLDTYPDYEATDELYLNLGKATMKAGLWHEASKVFEKLYYLNLSPESQTGACLGLGMCHYRRENLDEASLWLKRYLRRTQETSGDELVEAMVLMGKARAAKDDLNGAREYLLPAISIDSSRQQNTRATLALVQTEIAAGNYVRALGGLERIDEATVPSEQLFEFIKAQSDVFCGMGLHNRGLEVLHDAVDAAEDKRLWARLGTEMGARYAEIGEHRTALDILTKVVGSGKLETGVEAQSASCQLAEACVELGKPDQAIAAVEDIQADPATESLGRRASEVLGAAYVMQGQYDKAAMAYAGKPAGEATNREGGAN